MNCWEELGDYLRSERELRDIHLEEISEATKIPKATLGDLEAGRRDGLPPETFLRGFVISYARYVGFSTTEVRHRLNSVLKENKRIEELARIESVGEAASEVGTRRRFGVALFVIILLIIMTITLSVFLGGMRSHGGPDAHASLHRQKIGLLLRTTALNYHDHV